jgi:hypothetical protein
MARKPRVEYAGAFYHVICRGNQRQVIFRSDADRKFWGMEEYRAHSKADTRNLR